MGRLGNILLIFYFLVGNKFITSASESSCEDGMKFLENSLNSNVQISCNKKQIEIIKKNGDSLTINASELNIKRNDITILFSSESDKLKSSDNEDVLGGFRKAVDGIPDLQFSFKTPPESIFGIRFEDPQFIACSDAIQMWKKPLNRMICDFSHRKYNGNCNHPQIHYLAESKRPFKRLLHPDYCDGVSSPRCSQTLEPLPNARAISTMIQIHPKKLSPKHSFFFMQWGQYISHDLSHTPVTSFNGKSKNCECHEGLSDECVNIKVSRCDKIHNVTQNCIPLARSLGSLPAECYTKAWREQLNQVTPLIDASTVYGSSMPLAHDLFEQHNSPYLKVLDYFNSPLLPPHVQLQMKHGSKFKCPIKHNSEYLKCFAAGDFRVNETPVLSSTHLLWVKQHNRLASELRNWNPDWSYIKIRDVARNIVIAQHQIITYGEYLPEVLGMPYMKEKGLLLNEYFPYGPYQRRNYNKNIDPRVSNVFATVAFRFGHSQITNSMKRYQRVYNQPEGRWFDAFIRHDYFNSSTVYNKLIGPFGLLVGALASSSQAVSSTFSDAVRNHLFSPKDSIPGLDLLAINIQRGRDHGIPSYVKWREYCNLQQITSFEDACNVLGDHAQVLSHLYKSVWDIDVYVGGLIEKPIEGGVVGETFACIIAEQFSRTRDSDRFWFENHSQEGSLFTDRQLIELRKTTLAKLICDNIPGFYRVQPTAMCMSTYKNNYLKECDQIPGMNMMLWAEDTSFLLRNSASQFKTEITDKVELKLFKDHHFDEEINRGQRLALGRIIYAEVDVPSCKNNNPSNMIAKECSVINNVKTTDTYWANEVLKNNLIKNGCRGNDKTTSILPTITNCKFRFKFRLRAFPSNILFKKIPVRRIPFVRRPLIKCEVLLCHGDNSLCNTICPK